MIRTPIPLLLLALLVGCTPSGGDPARAIPSDEPYIRGVVTAASDRDIRVEARPEQSAGSAQAVLRLTPETVVLWRSGDPAEPRDLGLGTQVRVWVDGPVLESYPVQATAGTVVIDMAGSQAEPRA